MQAVISEGTIGTVHVWLYQYLITRRQLGIPFIIMYSSSGKGRGAEAKASGRGGIMEGEVVPCS